MRKHTIGAYAAGILCANSLPHLATAAAGQQLMTPLSGPNSGRWANLAWGGANLTAGLALMVGSRGEPHHWIERLGPFGAGTASFAAWGVIGEKLFKFSSRTG